MKQITLFGGALIAKVPESFKDISDLVPVPDNQEIYQDMSKQEETHEANLGQLFIEILEQTQIENPVDAITYCFNDLAEANGSDMNLVKYAQKVDDPATLD